MDDTLATCGQVGAQRHAASCVLYRGVVRLVRTEQSMALGWLSFKPPHLNKELPLLRRQGRAVLLRRPVERPQCLDMEAANIRHGPGGTHRDCDARLA